MPRKARKRSKTGIYHIMVRGINRQKLFKDDEDYAKFIKILQQSSIKSLFDIYGYCLMGNYAHLLIREDQRSISLIMQRICSSFVYWYNWKYDRYGHLFQERYKSEVVEDEVYLLTVLRYIHQNPIKVGLTDSLSGYKWSSYHEYIGKQKIIDTEFILKLFASEKQITKKEFEKYMNKVNKDVCLDYIEKHRITDDEVIKLIEEKYGVKKDYIHLLERQEIDDILRNLKSINGITIRQIVRVTGVSKYKVEKV